jgi:hypothetical protein
MIVDTCRWSRWPGLRAPCAAVRRARLGRRPLGGGHSNCGRRTAIANPTPRMVWFSLLCFSPGKAETMKHLNLRIRALYQYIHYCIYIYGSSVQTPRWHEQGRRVRWRTPSFMSRPRHVAFQSSITKVTPSCFLKECVV